MDNLEPHVIKLQKANLVLVKAKNGYLMCGYLNLEIAQKIGDAAAIVTGVKTAEDAMKAQIKSLTTAARDLGVKEGMTGAQALELMNR
jgi:uncharacterized protein YunC (DUF1805 family)